MIDRARRVSIVICAYTEDRWPELVAAVDSVRHQTRLPQEIILVIDHNAPLLIWNTHATWSGSNLRP